MNSSIFIIKNAYRLLCLILMLPIISCIHQDKDEITIKHPKLEQRSTIAEKYEYKGIQYILYFNSEDTSSVPNNTSTADSLIAAIGNNGYILTYDSEFPDITFIKDPEEPSDADSTLAAPAPLICLHAEFFEHINYGGEHFCVDVEFSDYRFKFESGTSNICSEFFGNSNLANRNFPGGGNWANKISSFKMYGDGSTKAWYDSHGYSNKNAFFFLFRDPGYPHFPNTYKYWKMDIGPYGVDVASWNVPNLRKERWGFWGLGGNFNDDVESIYMTLCKCSNSNNCFTR